MPRLHHLHLVLCITLLSIPALTANSAPSSEQTAHEVILKGQHFSVELATTQMQRARGLMFRSSMPSDHGMLFLFPKPRPMAFWMKNTAMPLDILFFDQQARLIAAHYNVPPCRSTPCAQYSSGHPAALVLELNGGRSASLKLAKGDKLTIVEPEKLPRPQ